ncbi:hypothetical protein FBR05_01700 [Deltaproteobacteria bacterium PRO3]|nr:hypothetical protein [Deltaproteobacteria bacterium PRO3]
MSSKIALYLLLGMLALSRASAFMAIPSAAAAQAECDCKDIKALQAELRNAARLQQAFRNKIPELRKMGKAESTIALKQFAEGEARRGLEPVPGYKGPSEVDYHPWGRDLYDPTGTKHSAQKLCSMSSSAAATLDAAVAASACPGIGRALRAHEAVHLIFCVTIGFFPYEEMHAADRAQEEVEAYAAQIKVLREILDSLKPKCKSYRASGRTADLVYSGVICSLEQPFTVSGSIINYKFNFTPSSATSGTVNISAAGMMVTGAGGGTYNIEGVDTDKPRIAITASVVGHSPVGSRTGSGTVYIDLTPLETSECDQNNE